MKNSKLENAEAIKLLLLGETNVKTSLKKQILDE